MKRIKLKKFVMVVAFAAVAMSFTSCNRGYGCPNNFSLNNPVVDVVKAGINTAITIVNH